MAMLLRRLLAGLGLGALGLLTTPASGALLATWVEPGSERLPVFALATSFDYDICLRTSDASSSCAGGPILFDSLVLSATDAGSVFSATAATDPGFAAFAASLTNGNADRFILIWAPQSVPNGTSAIGQPELNIFGGPDTASLNGIDLAGFSIDQIELEIGQDFRISQVPGPFISYTTIGGTITMRVFGNPVPEPATAMLVGGGLLLLGSRRRRVA